MQNVPYWIDQTPMAPFPRLQANVHVDVLVIRAGVTGVTTAYFLKKAGMSVALIERERIASIDTGHTTAHLIARPEGNSIRKVKAGHGMMVGSRGKKVAAYRNGTGKLYKLSPVGPHMGCYVRWNFAEATWDCPCHGSRFKPPGEVIARPAEESLAQL